MKQPISTFRFGLGLLLDAATYSQDAERSSRWRTMKDPTSATVADLPGKFKTKAAAVLELGYMYDLDDESWRFRKTGSRSDFPRPGDLFIGRTKEGYSMLKVMVGYNGWTQERSPALDEFVPILADGLKSMGYSPSVASSSVSGCSTTSTRRKRSLLPTITRWSLESDGFRSLGGSTRR